MILGACHCVAMYRFQLLALPRPHIGSTASTRRLFSTPARFAYSHVLTSFQLHRQRRQLLSTYRLEARKLGIIDGHTQ